MSTFGPHLCKQEQITSKSCKYWSNSTKGMNRRREEFRLYLATSMASVGKFTTEKLFNKTMKY